MIKFALFLALVFSSPYVVRKEHKKQGTLYVVERSIRKTDKYLIVTSNDEIYVSKSDYEKAKEGMQWK